MAKDNKSNIGLRNVSNLLPKKVELKTTEIDVKTTDKVVQKIHSTQGNRLGSVLMYQKNSISQLRLDN
jgi:hypothetical protein